MDYDTALGSMEELKAASDKMFQDEEAAPFVKALDAASVKNEHITTNKNMG